MAKKVLLIDDEENVRLSLGFWLRRNDFQVTLCGGIEDARLALTRGAFDYVISDFRLTPGGEEGRVLIDVARLTNPSAKCILVTATPPDELPPALRRDDLLRLYHKPLDVFELLQLMGAPLRAASAAPLTPAV